MSEFIEFTYKDKDNRNVTAYYNTKEGTLKIMEYNQKDDEFDVSKFDMIFIWITLIMFGGYSSN